MFGPTLRERRALEYLRDRKSGPAGGFMPGYVGPRTISSLLKKQWIEIAGDGNENQVKITEEGRSALSLR